MADVKCGTTHYEGCACHEARHRDEVQRLREALRGATDAAKKGAELCPSCHGWGWEYKNNRDKIRCPLCASIHEALAKLRELTGEKL